MGLSCNLSRDIGRKSSFFHTPLAFDAPVRGLPTEYCHAVWCGKTRMVGLPDTKKTLRLCPFRHNTIMSKRLYTRSRHSLTLNISEVRHTDVVSMKY